MNRCVVTEISYLQFFMKDIFIIFVFIILLLFVKFVPRQRLRSSPSEVFLQRYFPRVLLRFLIIFPHIFKIHKKLFFKNISQQLLSKLLIFILSFLSFLYISCNFCKLYFITLSFYWSQFKYCSQLLVYVYDE